MKGTPIGTRHRRRAVVAVTAATLAVPGAAEADKIVVSKTAARGKGSFAAAVRKADSDKDLDAIVFARSLRGEIRIPKQLRVDRPVRIQGRGYGKRGSKRFARVSLRGADRGSVITFGSRTASRASVDEMFLDRVALTSDATAFSVRSSHLTGRKAVKQPGISPQYAYGDETRVLDSTIAGFRGGGILPYRSETIVERSTISGNLEFGVASTGEVGRVVVKDSTISSNYGVGAVGHPPADLRIVNSTISGNSSESGGDDGGGVFGDATVIQSTIVRNGGIVGGVSSGDSGYELRVANSVIADNRSSWIFPGDDCGIPDDPEAGEVHSLGGNLIEDPGACELKPTDRTGVRPRLERLRDNGGPTKTHALRKASPAIGLAVKREATKRDQRGVKRGKNPDSGAFELR